MLSRRQTSRADPRSERIIMMPPMVGVPFFCIWPSSPRSRMVSPIWCFWRALIILPPAKNAMSILITTASIALNER